MQQYFKLPSFQANTSYRQCGKIHENVANMLHCTHQRLNPLQHCWYKQNYLLARRNHKRNMHPTIPKQWKKIELLQFRAIFTPYFTETIWHHCKHVERIKTNYQIKIRTMHFENDNLLWNKHEITSISMEHIEYTHAVVYWNEFSLLRWHSVNTMIFRWLSMFARALF